MKRIILLFIPLFIGVLSAKSQINDIYYEYVNHSHTLYAQKGVLVFCSRTFLYYTHDLSGCEYYYYRVNVGVFNMRTDKRVKFKYCKIYKNNEWCNMGSSPSSVSFAEYTLKPGENMEGSFCVEVRNLFEVKDLGYSISWSTVDW